MIISRVLLDSSEAKRERSSEWGYPFGIALEEEPKKTGPLPPFAVFSPEKEEAIISSGDRFPLKPTDITILLHSRKAQMEVLKFPYRIGPIGILKRLDS